jgi:hypothetical protein
LALCPLPTPQNAEKNKIKHILLLHTEVVNFILYSWYGKIFSFRPLKLVRLTTLFRIVLCAGLFRMILDISVCFWHFGQNFYFSIAVFADDDKGLEMGASASHVSRSSVP